jgi:threonine aldolase
VAITKEGMIPMKSFHEQQFASDNYSGICPEALDAILSANKGHVLSYGEDEWTEKASNAIREVFEQDCEVFFVFNGTAANSLALASLCQSYHSIITADTAHIETDECGAPEFFSNGSKILTVPNRNGKLTPESVEHAVTRRTDIHYPKPKVISLTQATEVGTVYDREELLALRSVADKHALKIHMDGARFANAVASLGLKPKQIAWECGVDVLCFGGTKNGLAVGEAVVFFDKKLAEDFDYRCKQAGQLASKMRFISAAWYGLLSSGAWLKNAAHANACAQLLENGLIGTGLTPLFPRQVNSLFVKLSEKTFQTMHEKGWHFYNFIGVDASRLMCSWDTKEETVSEFLMDLKDSLTG